MSYDPTTYPNIQINLTAGWSAKRGLFVDLKEPAKWKKGP